jgi:Domain of unknown function (DUF1737)
MKKYVLLQGFNICELTQDINGYIRNGWELHGNTFSVFCKVYDFRLFQAMIKNTIDEPVNNS